MALVYVLNRSHVFGSNAEHVRKQMADVCDDDRLLRDVATIDGELHLDYEAAKELDGQSVVTSVTRESDCDSETFIFVREILERKCKWAS